MPLKLVEASVDRIPVELRTHYLKVADGSYRLSVSDLEIHLRPLKATIAKFALEGALREAHVRPGHVDMLLRRLGDRVAVELKDGETAIRVRPSTDGSLSEADGATTLDELVSATAEEFPFLFGRDGEQPSASLRPSPAKTITRSEFSSLSAYDRRKKVLDEKVQVVDDPEAPKRQPRQGVKEMARADFDALGASERAQRMSDGWTLFD